MDSLIPAIIITVINVIGWVYTRVYSLGKLNAKVDRHEKMLDNGLPKELNELKREVSNLEGTVKTYIDLTKPRD